MNENYLVIISNYAPITIPSTSIQRIKIKCTNCAGRGALKGGLIGAGVGIGIGFLLGDDESESELEISFTAGEKALMGGIALGGIGALIGTLGGFVTAEYIEIEGDQRVYTQYLVTLKKYEQMPSEKE